MNKLKKIMASLAFISGITFITMPQILADENPQSPTAFEGKEGFITQDQAETIALNEFLGRIVETTTIEEDDQFYYLVHVESNVGTWEVYINAQTQEIEGIVNMDESQNNIMPIGDQSTEQTHLTIEDAKSIARDYVSGRVIYTGLEFEHGRQLYSVYVFSGMTIREIYIDVVTGQVLEIDTSFAPVGILGGLILVIGGFVFYRTKHKKKTSESLKGSNLDKKDKIESKK